MQFTQIFFLNLWQPTVFTVSHQEGPREQLWQCDLSTSCNVTLPQLIQADQRAHTYKREEAAFILIYKRKFTFFVILTASHSNRGLDIHGQDKLLIKKNFFKEGVASRLPHYLELIFT